MSLLLLFAGAGGPPTSTGTLAATDPIDTAAFAGDVLVEGDLAATEGLDTAAITGDVIVQGALAVTEGTADTAAFAGTVTTGAITGTLAVTEALDTAAFAGDVIVEGDLAATDSLDVAAFAGTVTSGAITGTLAATEALDTAALQGTVVALQAPVSGGGGGGTARRKRGKATFRIEPAKTREQLRVASGILRASEKPDTAAMRGKPSHRLHLAASEPQDMATARVRVRWTDARRESAHLAAVNAPDYGEARKIGEAAIANYIKRRNQRIIRLVA